MTAATTDSPALAAVRDCQSRWADAVARADIDDLAALMADDIVVVHGDGRRISGRDAVLGDFARAFGRIRVSQQVESEETVVSGEWAFDLARVCTRVTPLDSAPAADVWSRTLTLLRRSSSGWLVARVIGVVERT